MTPPIHPGDEVLHEGAQMFGVVKERIDERTVLVRWREGRTLAKPVPCLANELQVVPPPAKRKAESARKKAARKEKQKRERRLNKSLVVFCPTCRVPVYAPCQACAVRAKIAPQKIGA